MNLRLTPEGELHLSVPYGTGQGQIEAMVRRHRDWIVRNQRRMQGSAKQRQRTFAAGETIYVWGKVCTIEHGDVAHATLNESAMLPEPSSIHVAMADRSTTSSTSAHTPPSSASTAAAATRPILYLPSLPASLNNDSPESIEVRKQLVLELFSHEVRREVERIYPSCAKEVGAAASSITVRYMTTRWGSCTPSTRRIRMNSALAAYDPQCLREVLIHELCHIHEANHSARFWALMDEHCPDWRTWQAELKSRGPLDLPR